MLVLKRRLGQEIVIGSRADIRVKVLSNDGEFVRLGIAAPKEITVNRQEVHDRIQGTRITINQQDSSLTIMTPTF